MRVAEHVHGRLELSHPLPQSFAAADLRQPRTQQESFLWEKIYAKTTVKISTQSVNRVRNF